jgi:hypothetical protein
MAAALFGGACTSTHHVPRPASVAELAARARDDAGGGPVAIVYPAIRPLGGAAPAPVATTLTREAPVARYAPDAVELATAAEPTRLSLFEVRGYAVTRQGRGALEGALVATAAGVVIGAVLGAMQGSDPAPTRMCSDYDGGSICTTIGGPGLSAGEKAALTGVGLGVVGAGVGALVGLLVGHTDRFEF